jgi:prevent-host-death family protein
MRKITATEARARFGSLILMAQAEPVMVQKNGKDAAVVMSVEHYEDLLRRAAEAQGTKIDALLARSIERRASLHKGLN